MKPIIAPAALFLACTSLFSGAARAADDSDGAPTTASSAATDSNAATDALIARMGAQLGDMAKELHSLPTEAGIKADCLKTFSARAMASSANFTTRLTDSLRRPYLLSMTCRAIQLGSVQACETPPELKSGTEKPMANGKMPQSSLGGLATGCRDLYWESVQSKILITAASDPAGAQRRCVEMESRTDEPILPVNSDAKSYCEAYLSSAGDPKQRAATMLRLWAQSGIDPSLHGRVEGGEALYQGLGTAEGCAKESTTSVKAHPSREGCNLARLFRAAYAKKDPRLCGESEDAGLCRAQLGLKDACDEYGDGLASAYCSSPNAAEDLNAHRMKLGLALKSMMVDLHNMELSIGKSKARMTKVAALKKQCSDLIRAALGARAFQSGHPTSPKSGTRDSKNDDQGK